MSESQDWGKLVVGLVFGAAVMGTIYAVSGGQARPGGGSPASDDDDSGSGGFSSGNDQDTPPQLTTAKPQDAQVQPAPVKVKPERDRGAKEKDEAEQLGRLMEQRQTDLEQALKDKGVGQQLQDGSTAVVKKQGDADVALREFGISAVVSGISVATGPIANIALATAEVGHSMINASLANKEDPTKGKETLQTLAVDLGLNEAGKFASVAGKAVAGGVISAASTIRAGKNAADAQGSADAERETLMQSAVQTGDAPLVDAVKSRDKVYEEIDKRGEDTFATAVDDPDMASAKVLATGLRNMFDARKADTDVVATIAKHGADKSSQADQQAQQAQAEIAEMAERKQQLEEAAAQKQHEADEADRQDAQREEEEARREQEAAAQSLTTSGPQAPAEQKSMFSRLYEGIFGSVTAEVDREEGGSSRHETEPPSSESNSWSSDEIREVGSRADHEQAQSMSNEELDEHLATEEQQIRDMESDGVTSKEDIEMTRESYSNYRSERENRM